MKRIVTLIVVIIAVVAGAILLTSGNINMPDENDNQKPDSLYDKTDLGYLDEVLPEGTDEGNSESDTDKVTLKEEKEASYNESLPGPEIALLVNLRGDETTVYKLADGTYMNRIEKRFTFNGTDTWTDENGVEWNEKVE